MRDEPIISPTLEGLVYPLWLYVTSGWQVRVQRVDGWWQLMPRL